MYACQHLGQTTAGLDSPDVCQVAVCEYSDPDACISQLQDAVEEECKKIQTGLHVYKVMSRKHFEKKYKKQKS
jgi:hypothetical protein